MTTLLSSRVWFLRSNLAQTAHSPIRALSSLRTVENRPTIAFALCHRRKLVSSTVPYSTHAAAAFRTERRELPRLRDRRPLYVLAALIVIGSWTAFAAYATNKERLSSAVFRSVLIELKDSARVREALGSPVMLVPSSFGDPWVSGSVNIMQGRVDISFRIQGQKDVGTVYFTSIRRDKERSFEILRFLVVADSGNIIPLVHEGNGKTHDPEGDISTI